MALGRRRFLGTAALATGATALRLRADSGPALRVGPRRLREHIEGLSVFGRPPGGRFADGVSRVAFSGTDLEGRAYVLDLIAKAGLEPRIDAAGNILARREGQDPALPPVLFGSHLDSVPEGGNFDGPLGTLAALEALWVLQERGIATRRPLELVIWVNEEGVAYGNGLFGSRAAAGHLSTEEMDHLWEGVSKADAVRKIGGDPDRLASALRPEGSVHCYLELHIEQGGVLDKAGVPIGVVEGIVAIDRYDVVIRGVANHAGTTPMPDRKDALIAAAELILAVHEIVTAEPGRQVGTVGKLEVAPGAPNVVPGLVTHTIELRDLSSEKIARLARLIEDRTRRIAARTRTEIAMTPTSHHEAALAAPQIQEAIEAAADRLGLAHQRMPSGAGHDAQVVASFAPMGMIFVPSVGGVSHSPKELTRWEDCTHGADVLLGAVVALAS